MDRTLDARIFRRSCCISMLFLSLVAGKGKRQTFDGLRPVFLIPCIPDFLSTLMALSSFMLLS
jgi:hypothetical protein